MPVTTTVSLSSLIDETYDALYRSAERPARVVVGSDALPDTTDTNLTLSSGSLDITDRIEGPAGEVMLVTGKSADATPVYTVARGYESTPKAAQPTGTVLLKNPPFKRQEVTRWIQRAVSSLMNSELPYVEVQELTRHATKHIVELPANTIRVLRVRQWNVTSNRMDDLGRWQFEEVPTSVATSQKVLRPPRSLETNATVIVDVQLPYTWVGTGEAATVPLPVAAQDIPVLWAAAYGQSRREVSRAELDKVEEWYQEQSIRAGVNLRMIRDMWGEVYRRVDEAQELHQLPKGRPYRRLR